MTSAIEIANGLAPIIIASHDPQSPQLNVPAQGPRGRHGGLAYGWDVDTDVSEPAVGRMKINSADFSTATVLSINTTDADGNNVEPEIAGWGGSQNPIKAIMRLMKVGDPDSVVFFHLIDNGEDHDTWWQYTIQHVRSAGSFDAGTALAVYAAYSGYKGDIGPAGPTGVTGPQGDQGIQGDPGPAYGITFLWSNNTTTNTDPGVGFVRFNNATLTSITQIALDDQSSLSGNPNVSPFMLIWDDSTNLQKGYLTITEVLDPTTFITFSITSLTDQVGYMQVNGSVVSSNGTFTNGGVIVVQFARTGDIGVQGGQGDAVGVRFNWSSSITTNTDPGLGSLRFNNATMTSVTQLAIDDLSSAAGNPDVSGYILAFDDANNPVKGYVTIIEVGDPSTFFVFRVDSISDQVGYTQLNGVCVASGGSFTNAGSIVLDFTRSGDQGPSANLPAGSIIQVLEHQQPAYGSTNLQIPDDDTIPLVSEGVERNAQAITLSAAANKVLVSIDMHMRTPTSTSAFLMVALFRGSTCIKAVMESDGVDWNRSVSFETVDVPGSVGPHTYSVRCGTSGGTIYFNGKNTGRMFGGVQYSSLILREVKG